MPAIDTAALFAAYRSTSHLAAWRVKVLADYGDPCDTVAAATFDAALKIAAVWMAAGGRAAEIEQRRAGSRPYGRRHTPGAWHRVWRVARDSRGTVYHVDEDLAAANDAHAAAHGLTDELAAYRALD